MIAVRVNLMLTGDAEPSEAAALAAELLSSRFSALTGAVVALDGGFTVGDAR